MAQEPLNGGEHGAIGAGPEAVRSNHPFAKDCDCVTHGGAHWLHMDELDFALNLKHLRETGGIDGFLVEEVARLNRLRYELGARKIGVVRAEDLPPGYTTESDKTRRTMEVIQELRAKGVTPK